MGGLEDLPERARSRRRIVGPCERVHFSEYFGKPLVNIDGSRQLTTRSTSSTGTSISYSGNCGTRCELDSRGSIGSSGGSMVLSRLRQGQTSWRNVVSTAWSAWTELVDSTVKRTVDARAPHQAHSLPSVQR